MPTAELSDEQVFGTQAQPSGELTDEHVFGSAQKELSDSEVFGSGTPSPTPASDAAVKETSGFSGFAKSGRALLQGAGIPTSIPELKEAGKFLIRSPIQDVKDIYQGLSEIPSKVSNFRQTVATSPAAAVVKAPLSPEAFSTYGTVLGTVVAPEVVRRLKAPEIQGGDIRATEKGQIAGSVPSERAGDVTRGPSAQTSVGGGVQPETQIPTQETIGGEPIGKEQGSGGIPQAGAQAEPPFQGATRQAPAQEITSPSPAAVSGTESPPAAATPSGIGGPSIKAFERIYGPGEIPGGVGLSPEEMFQGAQERAASGKADPYAVVARAKTGAITPEEFSDLVVEHDRLVNEAAAKEGTPEYEPAYQMAKDFATRVLSPAKTRVSDTMRAMQIEAPIDYSRLTGFRAALEKRIGREMTPQEAPEFQKAANDVARARDEARTSAVKAADQVQKRFAGVKDISFEDAVKQIHDSIEKAVTDCAL
jgi:hypothetical protein